MGSMNDTRQLRLASYDAAMYPRDLRPGLLVLILPLVMVLTGASAASAQSASPRSILYGISGGPGRRTTNGTFAPTSLPAGATQVASDRTTAILALEAGIGIGRRVGLLGIWDQTFGGNGSTGRWGASSGSAVARAWPTRRVWLEAGGGVSGLGYKAASGQASITRFWAPGLVAGVGAEVLQGRRVSVTALARVTRATFNGLTVNSLTFQMGLFGRE